MGNAGEKGKENKKEGMLKRYENISAGRSMGRDVGRCDERD